jgi:HSP20 family protein
MITFNLKPDPLRIGWYTPDDMQRNNLDSIRWRIAMRPHSWRPPTDVYETDEAIVVRVEIAGMREADFSISLDERSLQIRGVRPDNPERRAYHQMEILFGEFGTEVELPYAVEADKVEAIYRDGFLRIVLPKVASHLIHVDDQEESDL